MMRLLKAPVVLLNFPPFASLFHALHRLAVRVLIARLSGLPAVHSIYGRGSFFTGEMVYGISDVDFMIVVGAQFGRQDPAVHELRRAYKLTWLLFPFLARWKEQADNLIFLSEIEEGYPVPDSFRWRLKEGELKRLYGAVLPEGLVSGRATLKEIAAEVSSLLRLSLSKNEKHTRNLRFWKRMFTKLFRYARLAGLHGLADTLEKDSRLAWAARSDVSLYFASGDPNNLFAILLEFATGIFHELGKLEPRIRVAVRRRFEPEHNETNGASRGGTGSAPSALRFVQSRLPFESETIAPALLGISPDYNYFTFGRPIRVFKLDQSYYRNFRLIVDLLEGYAREGESYLISAGGFYFAMIRRNEPVDIQPLDPLAHANFYSLAEGNESFFDLPGVILDDLKRDCKKTLLALVNFYRKSAGKVVRSPYICLYSENDRAFMSDALHRLRTFTFVEESVDAQTPAELIGHLTALHPHCADFLSDLHDSYLKLLKDGEDFALPPNLYRCLHIFMAEALSGKKGIELPDYNKKIAVTVGVITRNRSRHLEDLLNSLVKQRRQADEVLIIDNGSNDDTPRVVDRFKESLPISYYYREQASIPGSRNMALEKARFPIVAFTDDDCIVEPGWVAAIESGFSRADNIGILGGRVRHEPAARASLLDDYYRTFHDNST